MRFEWNDKKALENLKKHGVTFGEATEVFYDPNAVETEDTQHSVDETRFRLLDIQPGESCSSFSQNGIAA